MGALKREFVRKGFWITMIVVLLLSTVASIDIKEVAAEKVFQPKNISFAPGANETAYNFSWYTEETSQAGVVQYVKVTNDQEVDFNGGSVQEVQATLGEATTGNTSHKAIINHIESNATYMYRLGDGNDNWSEAYTFQTYDPNTYNFLLMGDPQLGASKSLSSDVKGWEDTVNKAVGKFPQTSFMLTAGDQVEHADSEEQYDGFFTPDLLKTLPTAISVGNHDNSKLFSYHFNVPNESDKGKSAAGGNYHFTHGDSLFIVLNSNNRNNEEHAAYLKEVVQANEDKKWKFVMFHHSFYSAASHSLEERIIKLREDLVPTMDALNIDAVLAGHDHSYVRTYQMLEDQPLKNQTIDEDGFVVNPKGTLYLTANSSSGSKYYNLKPDHEYYAAVREQLRVPTFTNVEITPTTIQFNTYRTDTMEMVDTYGIKKDKTIESDEEQLDSVTLSATDTVLPIKESNLFNDVTLQVEGKTKDGEEVDLLPSQINYRTSVDNAITVSNRGKVSLTESAIPGTLTVTAEVEANGKTFTTNAIDLTIVENDETTLFSRNSEWKFLDDGSDQGKVWKDKEFDDSSWKTGAAPLGFPKKENRPLFGSVETVVDYGPDSKNKHATTYFRTTFEIDDLDEIGERGYLNYGIDDSMILYLNGQEIDRFNLPEGNINFDDYTSDFPGFSFADEGRYETAILTKEALDLLVEGENVLAAEVHNDRGSSSDLYWDMEMHVLTKASKEQVTLQSSTTIENKDTTKDGFEAGDAVQYTIEIQNETADIKAKAIDLQVELPEGVTIDRASVQEQENVQAINDQYMHVQMKQLAAGETKAIVFDAHIAEDTAGKTLVSKTTVTAKNMAETLRQETEMTIDQVENKEGKVTALFKNETDQEIAKQIVLTGKVGDSYTVEPKDIPSYTFVEVTGEPSGTFAETDQEVTFYYETTVPEHSFEEGTVITAYVNENGEEIASSNYTTDVIGAPYETIQKDIPGYTMTAVENEVGHYAEEDIIVTYMYTFEEELPFTEGAVTVKYVDENQEEIALQQKITNLVAEPYETKAKEIPGYELQAVHGEPTGIYTEEAQEVIYEYKTIEEESYEEGQVIVKYVDETGKQIAEDVILTGKVGTPYETKAKEIENYTFVSVAGESTGLFEQADIIVTYQYEQVTETVPPVPGPELTPEPEEPQAPAPKPVLPENGSDVEDKPVKEDGKPSNEKVNDKQSKEETKTEKTRVETGKQQQEEQTAEASAEGKKLPRTATSIYQYMAVGMILLLLGSTGMFIRKRSKQ